MQSLIEEFEAVAAERPFELIEEHARGTKIVEYTGRFIPEEIIWAAGAAGYPMWRGGEPEPPDAVLDESVRFLSPFVRTQYGLIKLGLDPVAEEADVYAFSLTDCHTYRICELIEKAGYPVCKVGVPTCWTDPDDLDYYAKKIDHLIERLEEVTGQKVTPERLEEAIEKYNAIRDLLRQIDEQRKKPVPPISGSQFESVGHCAMLCDPDVAVDYLQKILAACEETPETGECKPRIVMFGHAIAHGDYGVVRAVEKAGGVIVHEIMDDGLFEFSQDVELGSDPLEAIVRNRYLDVLPNNNMQPSWEVRREALVSAVRDYEADGVIWYDTLYDEIYDMEYSCMADFLSDKGIPLLRISTSYEYTREAMGPLNTRVETFVQNLKGGKRS